jgi:hypothetical protein
VVTIITEVPEESCELEPEEKRQGVYRLVPFLTPTHECEDVPREVCSFGMLPGRPGERPLTTNWCYDPESEADLQAAGLSDSQETVPASIPIDPFLPPSDPFQFPQQELESLDYSDSLSQEEELPTYSPLAAREWDSLYYIPPALELSQALEAEEREGRTVGGPRGGKVDTRRPEEEEQEDLSFLQEFLDTVNQDQEEPEVRFGVTQRPEEGTEEQRRDQPGQEGRTPRPVQLADILPEVFRFP